jgi:hypothetical protein
LPSMLVIPDGVGVSRLDPKRLTHVNDGLRKPTER